MLASASTLAVHRFPEFGAEARTMRNCGGKRFEELCVLEF
jgi:hypothetical protein